jgi:hypothetical protein
MGLDAYCGSVAGRLGSYGWFHSFRLAIAKLEGGVWGERFPRIQCHSDCDGDYSSEEAKHLLEELYQVEREFQHLPYPCAVYQGADGKELGYGASYSDDGTFMFAKGWSMGVDDEGLVFYPRAREPEPAPVHFKELAKGSPWFDLWFSKPKEAEAIVFGYKPAREVFAGTLDLFVALAQESVATGEPIVFC